MDSDVDRLIRAERLLEAAALASERGDARGASLIYERACDWPRAATEALRAGDARRALRLAVYAGDGPTAERAIALASLDAAAARTTAAHLARQGDDGWAARLLEACGRDLDAARAWERAAQPRRAAALFERAGYAAEALRVLQAALDRDPTDWSAAATLGALFVRIGEWESAARVLQRVPADSRERGEALAHLVPALERMGLAGAARSTATELASFGRIARAPSDADREGPHRPRLFGRYDVVREVASSPGGRVLECLDVVRGARVAVKMFAATDTAGSGRDAVARFESEARATRSMNHPGVVPLRDFVSEGPATVLEWMTGGTLEERLAAPEGLSPAGAIEIAASVLAALGAAHRLGVLHRNVKPTNVLFDDAGNAHLSDFGVAHLGDLSATATAGALGTLAYMSPEQREARPATARSDIFSVGILLREMLTRERPTLDGSWRLRPSVAHRALDARHDDAIAHLTAKSPDDRPVGALEAISVLTALPWPRTPHPSPAPQPAESVAEAPAGGSRLESEPKPWDRWIERLVEPVPLTEASLARARAFAQADHPSLQAIWRVDKARNQIWLEALAGEPPNRPLTADEHEQLGHALEALRAAGGASGPVDMRRVVVRDSGIVLRFAADEEEPPIEDRDPAARQRA